MALPHRDDGAAGSQVAGQLQRGTGRRIGEDVVGHRAARRLLPVTFAGFAFVVGKWVLPDGWTNRRALLFTAWLVAFTAASVVNRCSPGWCGTIGSPFAWESWSDNIMTGDGLGEFLDTASVICGAVADILTFVLIAALLVRPQLLRRSA